MIKRETIRNHILFNHPEWYAMRLWLTTLYDRHKFTRANGQDGFDLPDVVLAGPFKGMKYSIEAVWSEKYPKILGTYEKEIHPTLDRVSKFKYSQLINIGSAEGFYAIGLARKIEFENIITVDPLSDSYVQVKQIAADNNVAKVHHVKWLSLNRLNQLLSNKPTLLIIDCEGGEAGYLTSKVVTNLKFADVIVEVHSFLIQQLSEMIKGANALTHKITLIEQERRTLDDLPPTVKHQEMD